VDRFEYKIEERNRAFTVFGPNRYNESRGAASWRNFGNNFGRPLGLLWLHFVFIFGGLYLERIFILMWEELYETSFTGSAVVLVQRQNKGRLA
jgi:hypothetical protein